MGIVPPGITINISVIGVGFFNRSLSSLVVHNFESAEDIDLLLKQYRNNCYDFGFVFLTTLIQYFQFNIFPYTGKIMLSIVLSLVNVQLVLN